MEEDTPSVRTAENLPLQTEKQDIESPKSIARQKTFIEPDSNEQECYGTFRRGGVRTRLFEIDTYAASLRFYGNVYALIAVIVTPLWPFAWLLGIPAWIYASRSNDKLSAQFGLFALFGTAIGFIMNLIPFTVWITLSTPGALEAGIKAKKVVHLDMVDYFTAELMLLFCMAFSTVFYEYYEDLKRMKHQVEETWAFDMEQPSGASGQPTPQTTPRQTSPRGAKPIEKCKSSLGDEMSVSKLVKNLRHMPGWTRFHDTGVEPSKDWHKKVIGHSRGVFNMIADLRKEAYRRDVLALDIFIARDQWMISPTQTLFHGLYMIYGQSITMLHEVRVYFYHKPVARYVIFTLAFVRSILSRFWLRFYLGGHLFPTDDLYLAVMVTCSILVSFVTGWLWLMLVYKVLMQYRQTLAQIYILTALVDPDTRMKYSENILQSALWFHFEPAECLKHMRRMPLLDLRHGGNAATYWDVRDYVTLDRSSENLAAAIMLEITTIWLLIKFLVTAYTMLNTKHLPAVMAVTLFDLFVFGSLLLMTMHVSLQINNLLDSHKHMLAEAKYSVTMSIAGMRPTDEAGRTKVHSSKLARKLLFEQLGMSQEYESRDKIFFGATITPAKILSMGFMGFSAICSILEKMAKDGRLIY